jgi:phosphate transport system substrate-binding protein
MARLSARLGRGIPFASVLALVALFAFAPILTVRAQDATPAAGTPVPYQAPEGIADLSGSIASDGSSTVGPLTTFAAEEFSAIAPNVDISVDISGTGGGFERFCQGETDLQNASRAIEEDEVALCEENGVEYYEFQVAVDGLTVAVSAENDFLECLSVDQLAQIFTAESEITTWDQVDPAYPAEEISFFTAADTSGTYDFFTEAIGIDEQGQRGVADDDPAVTSGEDDNALVEGIAGDPNAIGYFGYSYYIENTDRLRAVAISPDGNPENCVEPTEETVLDGTYTPLSRPLYIYAKASSLEENEALQEFLRYYLADAANIATGVDFIPVSPDVYATDQQKLERAIAGEIEPDSAAS